LNVSDERSETVPYKDPDPTDPNMLVGVMLPADAEATRDMAYVFAEEFARLGYSREQLLYLFKNPFYGGAHGAYQALGENQTLSIIDECVAVWGGIKLSVQDVQSVQTDQTPSSLLPRDETLSQSAQTHRRHAEHSEASRIFGVLQSRDSSAPPQNDIAKQSRRGEGNRCGLERLERVESDGRGERR
jgi:hypothetical protein